MRFGGVLRTVRGGVYFLLLFLLMPVPALARDLQEPTPLLHPTGRPDAVLPPEGSIWIAAETFAAGPYSGGGGATVGARPLPGLVLSLHQTSFDDGSADALLRLWPEADRRPALFLGAAGLGGVAEDRSLFLGAGSRLGPFEATAGLSWRGSDRSGVEDWPDPWGSVRWQDAYRRFAIQAEAGRVGRHREPRLTGQYRLLPWMSIGAGAEWRRGIFTTLTLSAPIAELPVRTRPRTGVTHVAGREIWVQAAREQPLAATLGRAALDLAPPDGEITLHAHEGGLPGIAVTMMAGDLARAAAHNGSPEEIAGNALFRPADPPGAGPLLWTPEGTLLLDHGPGVENSGWVSRAMLDAGLEVGHPWGFRAGGALRLTLDSTADRLPVPQLEAAVRSDLADHAAAGVALERLYLMWNGRLAPGLLAMVEAGHFEEMFGGAGGELRWQSFDSRHSLSLELHHVWKRESGHIAVWRGTGRTTGLLTAGYDLPGRDAAATLSAGWFLDGDAGIQAGLERWFDNGAGLGGTVTWSDGVALGLRLRVPLDVNLGPVPLALEMRARPHGRDRGQRLERPHQLEDLARMVGLGRLARSWPALLDRGNPQP